MTTSEVLRNWLKLGLNKYLLQIVNNDDMKGDNFVTICCDSSHVCEVS